MNFIIGASGFAKEVDWLLQETGSDYPVDYFVAKESSENLLNGAGIIDDAAFENMTATSHTNNVFISIGSPAIRHKLFQQLAANSTLQFPAVIHPSVRYDKREHKVVFGKGTIICAGNIITTDIRIGSFVHINLDCTIGHDSVIGDFTTISPGAHISGNVIVGSKVFIGTGAVVLEKLSICDEAIVGAGAVVTKSITEPGVYAGIPAKKIK